MPNGDFESYTACLSMSGTFERLLNWYTLDPTPDYYACSFGVPGNSVGYQVPHSGQGYVGWALTESFGVRLTQPLVPGESYLVEAYVSLGNGNMPAALEITACFSPD